MLLRKILRKIVTWGENIINAYLIIASGIKVGKKCSFQGVIGVEGTCNIEIKDGVSINSGKRFNVIGGDCRSILRTVNNGKIIIGSRSGISNSTIVSAEYVEIGEDVLIGGSCKIYDTDFHPLNLKERIHNSNENIKTKSIYIDDGVFIGAHCIILKGVSIGKGSIVGAGSVVTKSIPKGELWAGNPAHFIKKLEV